MRSMLNKLCKGAPFAAAAFLVMLFAGCTGPSTQSSVDPMGPQAQHLSRLWWFFCYTLSAIFVIVIILLLIATFKGWRRRGVVGQELADRPETEPDPARERTLRNVVIGATLLSTLILFVYLVVSMITGRAISSPLHDEKLLTIEVTGHQWWWEVRYRNANASQMFTTANEIHVPVGQRVLLRMSAADVIHSFWVPNLMGKKDLIPGKYSTLMFQADRPGTYRGQCAEYCGLQHAHMALIVVAEAPEQFEAWREAQLRPAVEPASDTAQARGRDVFLSSPCIMCHTIRGTQAGSNVGPDLTHIASRQTIAAGTLANSRGQLAGWIVDSQSIKPGNRMPPNSLNPDDLQALLDYMQSLK